MFMIGGENVVTELTELDFLRNDVRDGNRSVVVFHRCMCWLVFTVFSTQRRLKPFNHQRAMTYALRWSVCLDKSKCKIELSPNSPYSFTATNCDAIQTHFVNDLFTNNSMAKSMINGRKQHQLSLQCCKFDKKNLLGRILCDRSMFMSLTERQNP